MSKLNWSESSLSNLGRIFLRNVLDHMREGSIVSFGETGEGIQPNYQVTYPNGVIKTIRGSSHKKFDNADEFNTSKISPAFSLADIQRAYARS
jgi:hypothetical protein